MLWAYTSPALWEVLIVRRGWSPARFAAFQARALISALLPPAAPSAR